MENEAFKKETSRLLHESVQKIGILASNMCSKRITTEDVYKVLIAVELSKESYVHDEYSINSAISYLTSLNDYLKNK